MTTEQLAAKVRQDVKQMTPREKAEVSKHFEGGRRSTAACATVQTRLATAWNIRFPFPPAAIFLGKYLYRVALAIFRSQRGNLVGSRFVGPRCRGGRCFRYLRERALSLAPHAVVMETQMATVLRSCAIRQDAWWFSLMSAHGLIAD
jgi:hypothetical protein